MARPCATGFGGHVGNWSMNRSNANFEYSRSRPNFRDEPAGAYRFKVPTSMPSHFAASTSVSVPCDHSASADS